jgi:hypothetical protein
MTSNQVDELGFMAHKHNWMDNLTLVHCMKNLKFKDDFFDDKEFDLSSSTR